MNDLSDRVKRVLSESKTRLDFIDAIQHSRDLIEDIYRDGALLEMQKRNAVTAVSTAIDVLQHRYDSPLYLKEALLSVRDVAHVLQEPPAALLAQWFFHVVYNGHDLDGEAVKIAGRIIARRQPDHKVNERKLKLDLDRYEWLASFGPNPELTRNNAKGVIVATKVLPLPAGTAEAFCMQAFRVLEVADERSKKQPADIARESLMHCRKFILEASQEHSRDPTVFMPQIPSFCARVSLSSIDDMLRTDASLIDIREDLAEEITEFQNQLNVVGFRSSSAVFAQYQHHFESFRESMLQSIDFDALSERLRRLQNAIKNARKGRPGIDHLSTFHANEARTIVSGLFEDLKRKQGSTEELTHRLRQLEEQIEQLERHESALTTGPIKKLQADLKRGTPLVSWVEQFPDRNIAHDASQKFHDMRTRLGALWERVIAEEPARGAQFRPFCTNLTESIRQATELPQLLPELLDLRRSLEEFSAPVQQAQRPCLDEVFRAFRERARNAQLLTDYIRAIHAQIDRAHRRIFSPIDFEDLTTRVSVARRWATLRDFPDASRQVSLQAAKKCMAEIYKLEARQQRMMAERETRAAEIFDELETDVADGVGEAKASPGRQECWDELVVLDRRLREASGLLNDHQRIKLRTALDEGFQKVREARVAFAVEAVRRFAYYNDVLGDILASLEELPTRESAFGAIDRLKPLRASLREERGLLKAQRAEINSMLDAASQAVEEIFESASAESKASATRLSADLDRLERQANEASDWSSAFNLIASHKQQSGAVREARLSIADRKDLRLRLERIWEDVAERLQQFRFSRASENVDAAIRRLEQQGRLLLVTEVPKVA